MVSYAWGDEEHQAHRDKVKALVDQLRADGIDVIFDRYRLRDGDDVDQFMEQVAASGQVQKVMAICDPRYVAKMNKREGGAGKEGMIMSQHVYEQLRRTGGDEAQRQRRFIALLFERDPELPHNSPDHKPIMFSAMKHIDMSSDELYDHNYEALLRFLTDQPEEVEPPLGQLPVHLRPGASNASGGLAEARGVRRLIQQDRPANHAWSDYFEALGEHLLNLAPAVSGGPEPQNTQFDMNSAMGAIQAFRPIRDEFFDLNELALRRQRLPDRAFIGFLERVVKPSRALAEKHRHGSTSWNEIVFAHVDFLVMQLFLYFTAQLIKHGQLETLRELTETTFFITHFGVNRPYSFAVFRQISEERSFSDSYSSLTKTRWTSATGQLLKEESTLREVAWVDLVTADFLLFLKSAIDRTRQSDWEVWWPSTGPYLLRIEPLPIFMHWVSARRLAPWLAFFNCNTVDEFKQLLSQAAPPDLIRSAAKDDWRELNLDYLLSSERWNTRP